MDLCQSKLEHLVLESDNHEEDDHKEADREHDDYEKDDREHGHYEEDDREYDDHEDNGHSHSDATIPGRRSSSVHSDPFDEELPANFQRRQLEWFSNPRTDPVGFYAVPRPEPASAEPSKTREKPKENLGTMGLLEQLFVPPREENPNTPKWTIGAPLPSLSLRRVSVDANDLSQFSLARPPTPPRRRPRPENMSDKPLPPLPRPRRFMSVGNQPLFSRARSQSTPGEFTLEMGNPSSQTDSTTEDDVESIIDAYEDPTTPAAARSGEPTANGEVSRPSQMQIQVTGPFLLHRLRQYQDGQLQAIAQMEAALANPHMTQSLRNKFFDWAQELLDLNFPFRTSTNPAFGEQATITEKDAHAVVDWAIKVGTKMNSTLVHIFESLNAADLVRSQLRSMCAGVDVYHDPPLPIEELYHKMSEVVQKRCRSPRAHEVNLLTCFLRFFELLLYNPFQHVKDRLVVVHNERPHNPVAIPLNIATPLSLLKRVLDSASESYNEYTDLTRQIRGEFFVPIEKRIPGVSTRTYGYLNNIVGPSNVI